jgi:hypothetical protein
MPADRGTTALVAARFRAGAVLAASITQCWQHCLQPTQNWTICNSLPDQQLRLNGPATPATQRLLALARDWFGLFPFPLF